MKESLEKLKFYDNQFKIFGISLVLLTLGLFLFANSENFILIILALVLTIAFMVTFITIIWGMIYHEFKRGDWGWFTATFVIAFLGGAGFFVSVPYYFFVMREEFKKGKGVYVEKKTKKDKEISQYYKEHKKEINKKDNEEFNKFLKGVGFLAILIILFIIIRFTFF